jgi:hypothetical protein
MGGLNSREREEITRVVSRLRTVFDADIAMDMDNLQLSNGPGSNEQMFR